MTARRQVQGGYTLGGPPAQVEGDVAHLGRQGGVSQRGALHREGTAAAWKRDHGVGREGHVPRNRPSLVPERTGADANGWSTRCVSAGPPDPSVVTREVANRGASASSPLLDVAPPVVGSLSTSASSRVGLRFAGPSRRLCSSRKGAAVGPSHPRPVTIQEQGKHLAGFRQKDRANGSLDALVVLTHHPDQHDEGDQCNQPHLRLRCTRCTNWQT